MKWSKTIQLDRPLRDVCLLAGAPVQDWQQFLAGREQAAYERGWRDGETALNAQILHQRNATIELQRGVLESLSKALPQVAHEAESALIDLALESARKIVAGMPVDAALVETTVREALRQTEDTAEILIQLHPEDLALLRENEAKILNGLPETGPLRFASSSEISRGGCLIQTRFGLIDARRETKIEQLRQSIDS